MHSKKYKGPFISGDVVIYKDNLYKVIKETKQYVRLYDKKLNNGFNVLKELVIFIARPLFP